MKDRSYACAFFYHNRWRITLFNHIEQVPKVKYFQHFNNGILFCTISYISTYWFLYVPNLTSLLAWLSKFEVRFSSAPLSLSSSSVAILEPISLSLFSAGRSSFSLSPSSSLKTTQRGYLNFPYSSISIEKLTLDLSTSSCSLLIALPWFWLYSICNIYSSEP